MEQARAITLFEAAQRENMWQTLLLSRWKPIFNWLPVETLISERQQEYYTILAVTDKAADSTAFLKLCSARSEML